jgi:Flp pilus assembly CpaE family ATPase
MPRGDMVPSQQWRATGEHRCLGKARYFLQLAEESSPEREAVERGFLSLAIGAGSST